MSELEMAAAVLPTASDGAADEQPVTAARAKGESAATIEESFMTGPLCTVRAAGRGEREHAIFRAIEHAVLAGNGVSVFEGHSGVGA
jgi:hypothetical protein